MKFVADTDELTIKLEGAEVFFGLRRQLVVPKQQITGLEWAPEFTYDGPLLRAAGAGFPGVLYAGQFRDVRIKEWLYLYVRNPRGMSIGGHMTGKNVLIVTTEEYRYKQIIVNCQPDIGATLTSWWQKR